MNKHIVVGAFLVVCLLAGTAAFAQTGTVRIGAAFTGLVDSENSDQKALGYDVFGRIWIAQLPQLTLNASYSALNWKDGDAETVDQTEVSVFGEYRVYNETNYGFSVSAGWLNQGIKDAAVEDAEKLATNYILLGGKGNYVLMDGLQAVAGVSYGFNNLFKKEEDPAASILKAKVGAEYDFPQVPGLKAAAYLLYNQIGKGEEDKVSQYGFNVAASYAVNF